MKYTINISYILIL